jgi:hypothetical protein
VASATELAPALLTVQEAPRREARERGGLTLGERLELACRSAGAIGAADCPVCEGRMRPRGDVLTCAGCGSRLS